MLTSLQRTRGSAYYFLLLPLFVYLFFLIIESFNDPKTIKDFNSRVFLMMLCPFSRGRFSENAVVNMVRSVSGFLGDFLNAFPWVHLALCHILFESLREHAVGGLAFGLVLLVSSGLGVHGQSADHTAASPGFPLCIAGTSRPCQPRLISACFPIKFSDRIFSF